MDEVLLWLGRLMGVVGALVCAVALGFEIGTLFLGGTAAMVAGCLCLLLRGDSGR
jgi:hypothetical protein